VKEVFESINDFIDLENIGTGNFTNVVKGRYKLTGKTYAIKVINKVEVNKVNKIEDV
jgi:serine/threonine protein kinase